MEWLIAEIQMGFKKLYPLRLKSTPPSTQIQATVEVWAESLDRKIGGGIESVDIPRIRNAFGQLVDTCEWWPSPAQLYKVMQPRPSRAALPVPDINQEGMERGRTVLSNILKSLEAKNPTEDE